MAAQKIKREAHRHLTLRVPWHDNRWNGTICTRPSDNSFCVMLDRIREERIEREEDQRAGQEWRTLTADQMPPCIAESGAFMNPEPWRRRFKHPYAEGDKTSDTHGNLKPTWVTVPKFSTFGVPFWWMLREHQDEIENGLPYQLPPDQEPPFNTPWVFGAARQRALLEHFSSQLTPEHSLVIFYTKEGHPFGEGINRLVVGLGVIRKVAPPIEYESTRRQTYPMWDTLISHSVMPDGVDGFLLPYHEYLEHGWDGTTPGDKLAEILVQPDIGHLSEFSYAAELASSDVIISILRRCLDAVAKIREHDIAPGPWRAREGWLNAQLAALWRARGAFPGLGAALEAFGLRLGTSLHRDLIAEEIITADIDSWSVIDNLFRGKLAPPIGYAGEILNLSTTWKGLPDERRALLKLLSRFDLTPAQAKRWYQEKKRAGATLRPVPDSEILGNPYVLVETDLGDPGDAPVSMGIVDRGLLVQDSAIAKRFPVPGPSALASSKDRRRFRGALISVLRDAEANGDTLLSITEAIERCEALDLATPLELPPDWLGGAKEWLAADIHYLDLRRPGDADSVPALQLMRMRDFESRLRKVLLERAKKTEAPVEADWPALVKEAIKQSGKAFDPNNVRHAQALAEQSVALKRIVSRRLTTLVGRAGTGKTSVLGALLLCAEIRRGNVLLLAPTGKATVRLAKAANAEAKTIASFLHGLKRYDGKHNRVLTEGKNRFSGASTVIIDECSMLTVEMLVAVLDALDLVWVKRLILVGDPNQLPPIGAGRPFADLVGFFDSAATSENPDRRAVSQAQARLTVEVRSAAEGTPSDTLRLASWFTREPQAVNADAILSDLELGKTFNDLEICHWKTPEDLRELLLQQFVKHLGLMTPSDAAGFNRALGFGNDNRLSFDDLSDLETFQVLSPLRKHPYGVQDLNRWIQRRYRAKELEAAKPPFGLSLGDEEIVVHDKVIQVVNGERGAYDWNIEKQIGIWLANGEIGLVANRNRKFLNVAFANRNHITVGYAGWDFSNNQAPLQLAYALTVHKAQGSEFRKVFVVLPRKTRLLTRELIYTALTRSRDHLVLLLEGEGSDFMLELAQPERSETIRRNTNLIEFVVRRGGDDVPYAEHLIHKTLKGHMVRSKSELVIANRLFERKIKYEYERKWVSATDHQRARPDFSFETAGGDVVLWEHLGMMSRQDYREAWRRKLAWYDANGFVLGETLFTTQDDDKGGLNSAAIESTIDKIEELV